MRALILIAGLVLIFAVLGWITFSSDSGKASVNLETTEIRKDTDTMLQKGSDLLDNAEEDLDSPQPEETETNN